MYTWDILMDDQNQTNEPTVQPTETAYVVVSPQPIRQNNTRRRVRIAGIVVIAGVLLAGGLFFSMRYQTNSISSPSSAKIKQSEETVKVAGLTLPKTDCAKVKTKINKQTFGDLCYEASTIVQGEKIQYIVVKQSQASYDDAEAKCTLDCGSYAGGLSRNDYVIRANGSVEDVAPDLSDAINLYLDPLTGCSMTLDDLKDIKDDAPEVKLSIKDGRIGFQNSIINSKYTDYYGNNCFITATWNSYGTVPEIIFASIKIHYDIKSPESCETIKELSITSCYAAQAALRSDISFCSKADEGVGLGNNQRCVIGVATRQRNANLCNQISNEYFRTGCESNVASTIEDFSGKLEIY